MPSSLETLRVLLWWQQVVSASGGSSPDEIEWQIRESDPTLEYEKTGNLRKFAEGSPPYRRSRRPKLIRAIWPERIQNTWPSHGTLAWLTTPFWFLMEQSPDSHMLLECIKLLPEILREDLVEDVADNASERSAAARFPYLISAVIYEIAQDVSPMRLGALACAMYRARLAGQAELERLAMVACARMLIEMVERAPHQQKQLLELLRDYYLFCAADHVFCSGVSMPLHPSEFHRFGVALEEHAKWIVERELEHMQG